MKINFKLFSFLNGTSGVHARLKSRIFRVSEPREDSGEENLQRPHVPAVGGLPDHIQG